MSRPTYMNPNPRVGVLLKIHGASVRLYNTLNPPFGMMGLRRFQRQWPDERLLRECRNFGVGMLAEWHALLARRQALNSQR